MGQQKGRTRLEVEYYKHFEVISDLNSEWDPELDRTALLKPLHLHQIQQKLFCATEVGFKSFPLYSSVQEAKSISRWCYEGLFAPPPLLISKGPSLLC